MLTVGITINLQRRAAGMHVTNLYKANLSQVTPCWLSVPPSFGRFPCQIKICSDTLQINGCDILTMLPFLPTTFREVDWSGDSQNGGILRFWFSFPRAKFCKGKSVETWVSSQGFCSFHKAVALQCWCNILTIKEDYVRGQRERKNLLGEVIQSLCPGWKLRCCFLCFFNFSQHLSLPDGVTGALKMNVQAAWEVSEISQRNGLLGEEDHLSALSWVHGTLVTIRGARRWAKNQHLSFKVN